MSSLSQSIVRRILLAAAFGALALPAHASATETGGASMPDEPAIEEAVCEDATAWRCARGAQLTLTGDSLAEVEEVLFRGRKGKSDNRVTAPQEATDEALSVVVPADAKSGRIVVFSDAGKTRAPQRLKVTPGAEPRAAVAPGEGVFPVDGKHDYGTATNGFGGGRGHKGHDVFANCGTSLVALYDATVQRKAFHSAAGNYVVLQTADGASYAYMHLQAPATVKRGDLVSAGQPIGKVGDTGRASGCHLHFEQWTAPGWYEGGEPVDPLPLLKSLDR